MVAPGGHVWLLWGACMIAQGGVHGCSGGACVVAPGGRAWDMTTYGDTVNEWAVRILLECILVLICVCVKTQTQIITVFLCDYITREEIENIQQLSNHGEDQETLNLQGNLRRSSFYELIFTGYTLANCSVLYSGKVYYLQLLSIQKSNPILFGWI